MKIRKDYYPREIAEALCDLSGAENLADGNTVEACEDAIYDLMAICENEYNRDCYRVLWDVLESLTERYDCNKIKRED